MPAEEAPTPITDAQRLATSRAILAEGGWGRIPGIVALNLAQNLVQPFVDDDISEQATRLRRYFAVDLGAEAGFAFQMTMITAPYRNAVTRDEPIDPVEVALVVKSVIEDVEFLASLQPPTLAALNGQLTNGSHANGA